MKSRLPRAGGGWVAALWLGAGLAISLRGAEAATYLVSPDGSGAFASIQEAIDVAADGDSVVLTPGVFTLDQTVNFRGAAVVLCSASGDPGTCSLVPTHGDEVVAFRSGEPNATTLAGVTIRDAYRSEGRGGGVVCVNSSPTIRQCIFENNRAIGGAGMYCFGSEAIIEDCLFQGNIAGMPMYPGWGGGIDIRGGRPRIDHCTFRGNQAGGTGGGINEYDAEVSVSKTVIMGNYAEAICCSGGRVTITDCVITGNRGAGVLCYQADGQMAGTTIAGNRSHLKGGGLWILDDGVMVVDRCVVWGNCADEGAGGVEVEATGRVEFTCSLVDSAGVGGDGTIGGLDAAAYRDPLFCDPVTCDQAPSEMGDYSVSEASPCTPGMSPCGQLIGALPAACASPPAARVTSWGALKGLFR